MAIDKEFQAKCKEDATVAGESNDIMFLDRLVSILNEAHSQRNDAVTLLQSVGQNLLRIDQMIRLRHIKILQDRSKG